MRAELNPEWKAHLKEFEDCAAKIEAMAKAARVPLVAVLVPNRAQAAVLSMRERSPGLDPYKLDVELHSIITRHGGTYIDILPHYRSLPHPERNYYAVDGHPDAAGHAVIAEFLAKELSSGAIPELRASDQSKAVLDNRG